MQNITIKVKDITCAGCANTIKTALEQKEGVSSAQVNAATFKVKVKYDETKIGEKEIKQTIVKAGYRVEEEKNDSKNQEEKEKKERNLKIKVVVSVLLTLPIFVRMFWAWEIPGSLWTISVTNWIQFVLSLIVVFVLGAQFHKAAFKDLKKFRANMDSLVSMGTLAAFLYSTWAMINGGFIYFESAVTITTLILLGRLLELKTKNRASRAMEKLMQLGAKKARVVLESGEEVEKPVEEVQKGDILIVKAGEKISLDGVVVEGGFNVDESMLTGESMPVYKKEGEEVFGATINQEGYLKIKVTKTGEKTMLSQIVRTVEEAQQFKPPIQKLADKIAGIFVPSVIGISLLTFLGWFLVTGEISTAVINAVAVLIISCPCALGIATPMAIMVGSSVGAKQGILVKDGTAFEKSRKADKVVFDKTGTLTKGEPSVEKTILQENADISQDKLITLASSVSVKSDHPLSKAIQTKFEIPQKELLEISDYQEVKGMGLVGKNSQEGQILLGNVGLMKQNHIDIDWAEKTAQAYAESGGSLLFVAYNQQVVGAFLIKDQIKEGAQETIEKIKELGIEPIMISGDNKYTAKNVATQLNIDNFLAELLPQEKQTKITEFQDNDHKVIFIGDGINDAPSLAQADLGIAMGSGTDIAKETGDIILMKNDLSKVVEAIKLSRKTFKVIKENLFWAFIYNTVAIPLAVLGLVNPMIGAIAMSLSDVTVIGNSLRLYRKR